MLLRSSWRFINRCPFVPFEQRLSIASRHAPVDRHNWSERLPILFRPSFWNTCYPNLSQYVRNRWSGKYKKKNVAKKKEWNPATFFFWMAIFIGSNSINLLLLKTEWDIFSRKADAKLAVLKEVIEKLQRGEEVDVEKALGTGDEIQEREWTEVVEEVEDEDRLWQAKLRKKQRKAERRAARKAEQEAQARDLKEAEARFQAGEQAAVDRGLTP